VQVSRTILKENVKNEMEENEEIELNLISEKDTDVEELTPEEAFMKMELINLPAYMFMNKENHQLNVIYKRPDGNFAWLNPKQ
jgi:hypothetical protein